MAEDILGAALKYLNMGFSVIPLRPRDKRPLIDWKPYQNKRPTEQEINQWWSKRPDANVGIVTGAISGIVVLDADTEKAHEFIKEHGMPPTPQAITGKGTQYYFKHPGRLVANRVDSDIGLDVRADGGYVVAPPSVHPNGKQYQWSPFLSPWETQLADLLPWMSDYVGRNGNRPTLKQPGWQLEALEGVEEGQRNQTAVRLAGRYVGKGLSDAEIESILLNWNQKNRPPLPEQEIVRTIQGVRATHERKHSLQGDILQFPDISDGFAGAFAALYGAHLEVSAPFLFMASLTCLGTILGDRLTLKSELAPQPRLFTVILGESADDRKSTAIAKTVSFFKDNLTDFNVCYGVGSAEGLQMQLRKSNKLLLVQDELKALIGKCKIEGSVLLPAINTLFESNLYESHTKTSSITINNAYLSILVASTVQTYERIWTAAFMDIGFTNRLFLVPGTSQRKFSVPVQIPTAKKKELADTLASLLKHVEENPVLELSDEARRIYDLWYMGLESSVHAKRLDTYGLRLMPLLAANELKGQIDREIVEKAIALCNWQLEVRRMYDPIDAENLIAKLEEKIRRCLAAGPKTDRDLKRHTHAHRSGLWFYETAKKNLIRHREILWSKKDGCYHIV